MILIMIFIGFIGLIIGSFLNVCIYRIPINQSIIFPSSHCVNCSKKLKIIDLIPVFSFIFLKGKCRHCGKKISFRYPLVEIITSSVFIMLFYKYSLTVEFFIYTFLMCILIIVFCIDIDYMIIPDELVIISVVAGFIVIMYNVFHPLSIYMNDKWWNPVIGAFVGSGFLLFISLIGKLVYKSEEVMGMGDVKIFIPIGIFLGWKMTIIALYLSIILAGCIGIILIISGKRGKGSKMAFGPFIVVGTFITLLYGNKLIDLCYRLLWSIE